MNYWEYDLDNPGFNSRLSEMQCALGFSQLKKLNKFLRKRKQIANFYNNYFKKYKFIKTPTIDKNKSSAHHLYYLRVNFKKMKISKSSFFKKLIKDNIFLQIHYIPTYRFSAYKDLYKKNKFKNNEKFYHEVFSIPLYVDLHKKDLKFFETYCTIKFLYLHFREGLFQHENICMELHCFRSNAHSDFCHYFCSLLPEVTAGKER